MADDITAQLFEQALAAERAGDLSEAQTLYERLLQSDPNHYGSLVNLANNCARNGDSSQAAALYTRATQARPDSKEALVNLANLHLHSGQLTQASDIYRLVLEKEPTNAPALNNLGNSLKNAGDIRAATASFSKSVKADPNFIIAQHNLLFSLNYDPQLTNEQIALAHRDWGLKHRVAGTKTPSPRKSGGKLRIGYVSPDFRKHSVATFFEPILREHDRSKFEITCYSNVANEDSTTKNLQSNADSWRDIHRLDDAAAASVIRADEIDILVDLAGHTAQNRLMLFSQRLAPMQLTALGYPNTSGLETIDGRLSEGDPPNVDDFYTENLYRLPQGLHCFERPANAPEVGVLPARKLGIVTFGSFNNRAKMSAETLALWVSILQQVPNSRLLLKNLSFADQPVCENVHQFFEARGVQRERIELLSYTTQQTDHLALYNQIDIALDTYPYCGVTTSCEALFMGVPVVTLAGATHAGIMGANLLSRLGVPELIARHPGDYIKRAVEMSNDLDSLAALRRDLRPKLAASTLMNAPATTQGIESTYLEMWQRCLLQDQ